MQTWKPIAAGLFNLFAGVVSLIEAVVLGLIALGAGGFMAFLGFQEQIDPAAPVVFGIGMGLFAFLSLLCVILSAVALRGGWEGVQRGSWGWTMAGSIATLIALFPFGILAVVFAAMSQDEMEGASPPPPLDHSVPPPPMTVPA